MWVPLEQLEQLVEELGLPDECPYCSKLSFATEAEAKDSARHSAKTRGQHLWVYECPKGKGWHLTSRKPNHSAKVPKHRRPGKSTRRRSDKWFAGQHP
tara:strand:+ start:374 stop:667 length:294 start_codon:yes stop_codon:yes gene_type:complete